MKIKLAIAAVVTVSAAACINDVDQGNAMGAGGGLGLDEQGLSSQCPSGPTVHGIDVSYYQGDINWGRVAGDGVKFAFIRVSDGLGFIDPKFGANWSGAKNAGILRGAYVFFEPGQSATAQADLLISKVGGHLGSDDLPPVLDVEVTGGQSAGTIANGVKTFMNRIKDKLGVEGIVYTGPYFWNDSVGDANIGSNDHKLWVAHYGTNCPLVPGAWSHWTFHQYTDAASTSGISSAPDGNVFNGTLAELKQLTAGPQEPQACVSHRFHGDFCDDDGSANEASHDQLKSQLGVDFHCADKAGSPAFCADDKVNRSQSIFVLGKAAQMPLANHPDAFTDDNNDPHEDYFNAAHAYGIVPGVAAHKDDPAGAADRDLIATWLYRMYDLQDTNHDYFFDDDGDPNEHIHNAVAAAGLFTGYEVKGRTRRAFKASDPATRDTLAVVAVRAHDRGLVPVWKIPAACQSGNYRGAFCDDEGSGNEAANDYLATTLGVSFSCGKLGGSPAYCGGKETDRAEVAYVLLAAAGVPLANHPDAFKDDDGNRYEKYLNAAAAYGIYHGFSGSTVKPDAIATRDTLAVVLAREYNLPPATQDYFSDDNGDANEDAHNRCAEAGLFTGYDDGHGGRKFEPDAKSNRGMLSMLAMRAATAGLKPVWSP